MKVTELKNNKTEYHAKISFLNKEIAELIDNKLNTVAKTAKMDGFRVGKVPVSILRKKHLPSIRADIIQNKINDSVNEVSKKNNLKVALEPVIEDLKNEEDKDLEFTIKFDLIPEIKMPEFKKISIEKAVLEVSKKDVNEQIKQLASFSKTYDKESKGKAKKGDQVTIDAVGYVDGKAFDGGKLDDHKLVLGSNTFIPGFEDQLIDSKAGDDVSVKVDFPKEYHVKDLAGKPSEFKVKVKAVHKATDVKIDDEFAKKFKCETLAKLEEEISKNIASSYKEPIHNMMKMKLFDELENLLKFDVPKSLLTKEIDTLNVQANQIEKQEIGDKSENKSQSKSDSKSEKEKKEYLNKIAGRRVKVGLMLAEYVNINKIRIEEEDIRQAIIAQARKYPGQEQKVIDFYQKNRNAIESLKGPILEEKAVKEIFSKEITIKEKKYSKDKIEKLLNEEIRD